MPLPAKLTYVGDNVWLNADDIISLRNNPDATPPYVTLYVRHSESSYTVKDSIEKVLRRLGLSMPEEINLEKP